MRLFGWIKFVYWERCVVFFWLGWDVMEFLILLFVFGILCCGYLDCFLYWWLINRVGYWYWDDIMVKWDDRLKDFFFVIYLGIGVRFDFGFWFLRCCEYVLRVSLFVFLLELWFEFGCCIFGCYLVFLIF